MTSGELAEQAARILAPALPYFLKLGDKAAEKAAEKWGESTQQYMQSLWGKLRPRLEARPAALEAVTEVAQSPDDEDALTVLRLQIKKVLAEDAGLAQEVQALIVANQEHNPTSVQQFINNAEARIGNQVNAGTIHTLTIPAREPDQV